MFTVYHVTISIFAYICDKFEKLCVWMWVLIWHTMSFFESWCRDIKRSTKPFATVISMMVDCILMTGYNFRRVISGRGFSSEVFINCGHSSLALGITIRLYFSRLLACDSSPCNLAQTVWWSSISHKTYLGSYFLKLNEPLNLYRSHKYATIYYTLIPLSKIITTMKQLLRIFIDIFLYNNKNKLPP